MSDRSAPQPAPAAPPARGTASSPWTVVRQIEQLCRLDHFYVAERVLENNVSAPGYAALAGQYLRAERLGDCRRVLAKAAAAGFGTERLDLVWLSLAEATGAAETELEVLQRLFMRRPDKKEFGEKLAARLRSAGQDEQADRVEAVCRLHVGHTIDRLEVWNDAATEHDAAPTGLYLDLLERTVCNWIYGDESIRGVAALPYDERTRLVGRDIPVQAHSMIGRRRLRHLRRMAEDVIRNDVPGDFIETGVWRGGACILMRGVLAAYRVTDRRVILADSFEGLPPPDPRYPVDALTEFDFHLRPELAVDIDTVRRNFDHYGLLDDQVVFVKGFFRDTLPGIRGPLAILRLDGDLYSSTMDTLVHLYDQVSPGGYVIIDDYGPVIDARRATLDFRLARGISSPMRAVDGDAVFWKKDG